jgi:hypothetical protein
VGADIKQAVLLTDIVASSYMIVGTINLKIVLYLLVCSLSGVLIESYIAILMPFIPLRLYILSLITVPIKALA